MRDFAINEIEKFDPADGSMFMMMSWAAVHGPIQAPESCRDIYPETVPEPRRTYLGMLVLVLGAIHVIL